MGGVNMLRALGHDGLERFHMNEGHVSLLPIALLDERAKRAGHPLRHQCRHHREQRAADGDAFIKSGMG
jgi:hypothetical protein